jgi:hypothetical protein
MRPGRCVSFNLVFVVTRRQRRDRTDARDRLSFVEHTPGETMPWRRTFAISATVHAADVAVAIIPPRAGGRAYGFLTTTVGGRQCPEDGGKGTGGGRFRTEGSATATRRSTTMEDEDDDKYDDACPLFDDACPLFGDDAAAAVVHPVVGRASGPGGLTTTTYPTCRRRPSSR